MVARYSIPIIQYILRWVIELKLIRESSASTAFGTYVGALSKRRTRVERRPMCSTVPSTKPSIRIQSPGLNHFSAMTIMPEIRFLNRSLAPNATATLKSPNPAMMVPTLIPQISRIVVTAINIKMISIALISQSIITAVKISSSRLNRNDNGRTIFTKLQKITNTMRERTI